MKMTMPAERARALRWAGEFLREIRSCQEVPQGLRDQAHSILRHYPDDREIASKAKIDGHKDVVRQWLAPEETLKIN